MEFISRREIQSFWDCQHVDWLYLGSIGALGGGGVSWRCGIEGLWKNLMK